MACSCSRPELDLRPGCDVPVGCSSVPDWGSWGCRDLPQPDSGRALLVSRVPYRGWSVAAASQAAGIGCRTGYKWLARFKAEGIEGLADRSSRPRRSGSRFGGRCPLFKAVRKRDPAGCCQRVRHCNGCCPRDDLRRNAVVARFSQARARPRASCVPLRQRMPPRVDGDVGLPIMMCLWCMRVEGHARLYREPQEKPTATPTAPTQ